MQWASRSSISSESMDPGRVEEKSSDLETAPIQEQCFAPGGVSQQAGYGMN